MLANSVSPPSAGISRAESMEARAGTGLKELSWCQDWFARLFSTCLSVAGAIRPSEGPILVSTISLPPAPLAPPRVVSSGPKRSLKATWAASSIAWPGKTSTEKRSNAARMGANSASPGGRRRSRPVTRAANRGWSGWVCSMELLLFSFRWPAPSGGLLQGRPRVLQRHAPHVAGVLAVLEGPGAMQGAAVVPHDEVVLAPGVAVDEPTLGGVLREVADQGQRLRHRPA